MLGSAVPHGHSPRDRTRCCAVHVSRANGISARFTASGPVEGQRRTFGVSGHTSLDKALQGDESLGTSVQRHALACALADLIAIQSCDNTTAPPAKVSPGQDTRRSFSLAVWSSARRPAVCGEHSPYIRATSNPANPRNDDVWRVACEKTAPCCVGVARASGG